MITLVRDRLPDLALICERYQVQRLALFGSAVSGTFAPEHSDLDFLVEFAALPPVRRAQCYFGLLHDLESLFGRPIDLVEGTAIRNPHFARSVAAHQEPLYAAA
ncbi:MAG: nucleotidyltransferase domain-containing protein [Chloroflexi bacterium]|nr:nucleotidyltransferase domain-containing protein [Chloroflexota bacterium]